MADKKISALTAASTPLVGTEVLPIVQSGSTVKVSVENVLVSAQPSGTANTVAYLNGSKQLSYSSNLAFDGSSFTFGVGGGAKLIAFNNQTIASINTGGSAYTDMLFDANDLIVRTGVGGATESLRVSDAGDVTAARGNVVIGTAGKGIDFSANGGDVLSQYDEGTWNVVWTNLTGTPTNLVGQYTRIGRQVTFTYATGAGAISGTAGNVRFTLPFTPAYQAVGTSIAEGPGTPVLNWIYTNGSCYPIGFGAAYMIFSGTYFI